MDSVNPQLIYHVWIWLSFPPKHAFALVQTQCGFPLSAMPSQSAVIICTTTTWMFRASIICWLATCTSLVFQSATMIWQCHRVCHLKTIWCNCTYLWLQTLRAGWMWAKKCARSSCAMVCCFKMSTTFSMWQHFLKLTPLKWVNLVVMDHAWTMLKLLPNRCLVVFNCTTIGSVVVLLFYIVFNHKQAQAMASYLKVQSLMLCV